MFGLGKGNLRSKRLKQKRRQWRLTMMVVLVLGLILLLVGLVMLARAEFVSIGEIKITGNATINQAAVLTTVENQLAENYLWLIPKRNIFLYPKSIIKNELLEQFTTAEDIELKRIGLRSIEVVISERKGQALWCLNQSKCYFLDEDGFIFSPAPVFGSAVYRKYFGGLTEEVVGTQFLSPEHFQALEAFVIALSSLDLKPTATYLTETFDYEVELAIGGKIIINQEENLANSFTNLEALWNSQEFQAELEGKTLEYLDLRFDNKVFYKISG